MIHDNKLSRGDAKLASATIVQYVTVYSMSLRNRFQTHVFVMATSISALTLQQIKHRFRFQTQITSWFILFGVDIVVHSMLETCPFNKLIKDGKDLPIHQDNDPVPSHTYNIQL